MYLRGGSERPAETSCANCVWGRNTQPTCTTPVSSYGAQCPARHHCNPRQVMWLPRNPRGGILISECSVTALIYLTFTRKIAPRTLDLRPLPHKAVAAWGGLHESPITEWCIALRSVAHIYYICNAHNSYTTHTRGPMWSRAGSPVPAQERHH